MVEPEKVPGVSGVILAGGASTRMGGNKSLLLHENVPIIEVVYRSLSELFDEVIVVTNTPHLYPFLPCRKVPDVYPGRGVIAGIHAGLSAGSEPIAFVAACDMPYLQGALIRYLTSLASGVDMVLPLTPGGSEPLHAVYGKGCLPVLEELLQKENQRVVSMLPRIRVREVVIEEVACFDPQFRSFVNINSPDDYLRLQQGEKGRSVPGEGDVTPSS